MLGARLGARVSPGGQITESTEVASLRLHSGTVASTGAKVLETAGCCNTAHITIVMVTDARKH